MSEFDVPSRLAEGEPAVSTLQHYVWACHQLGYRHPDLTTHVAAMPDSYGSEDGMDLAALQIDRLAFEDAHRVSLDALAVQDRQLSRLSGVWQGAGAQASRDFLRRHGEASAAAAAAARTAAEALCALRESLWQAVDAKVDAVIAIEARPQAQRADWLAAAGTVTTGIGDRAVAAELVDRAVKPLVDSSIRLDWVAAMDTAASSVTAAYRRAAAELAAEYQPVFEVPGDLGPTGNRRPVHAEAAFEERLPPAALAGPAAPVVTVPSGWSSLPAVPSAAPMPMAPAITETHAPPLETPVAPAVPAGPPMPPLAGMGSGIPDFGSGLSGLGQQFADTLSGLLAGSDGLAPAEPGLDNPDLDERASDEEPEGRGPDNEELDNEDTDNEELDSEDADNEESGEESEEETVDGPVEVAADSAPAPAPTPAPPAAEPLPPADPPAADPVAAEQTPCAIAADELPQVGDPPE